MKLKTYLTETNTKRGDLAKTIGVTEVAIHRYITGARIPRQETMSRIVAATNGAVQPNDFFDTEAAQ